MAQAVGQWFISLLALIFIPRIKAEQQVPDVLRCRRCKECQLTSYGGSISKDDGASMPSSASSSSFGPAVLGRPWDLIPSCQQCQGCNTHLESIKTGFKLYNRTFALEPPMSSSSTYVFQATTDLLPPGQRAVVKVFCVPPSDDTWSLLSAVDRIQACSARAYKRTQLVLALYHIGQDCGMTDLLPKMWVANVTGVIPGDGKASGRVISWLALWAERVQGLSLRSFLSASQLPPQLVMDTMHRKLNSTQVVLAAIFDLLTSQRDGHTKNIFIQDDGQITLIDIEDALGLQWTYWGINSVLIPTTKRHEATHNAKGRERLTQLLDYRCQLAGSSQLLGTQYPSAVSQCLTKIASKTVAEVKEYYQIPNLFQARTLKTRAQDMITKGFEWTYLYGEPRNYPSVLMPLRKPPHPPVCCKFEWHEDSGVECAHPPGNPSF